MSLHLHYQSQTGPSNLTVQDKRLRLLCAYENGSVVLREYNRNDMDASVEGIGWDIVWKSKLHVESSGKGTLCSPCHFIDI